MAETCHELSVIAINQLTEAIERRFGLKVKMGAEVEYCAFNTKQSRSLDAKNPLDVSVAAKSSGEPAKYFEDDPKIFSHYKEKPPNQYEVVLNHEAFDHPLQLAAHINTTKDNIRALGDAHKLDVTFAPAVDIKSPNGLTTSALHLNFSLLNSDNKNVLADDPNVANYLLHHTMDVMKDSIAIQAPTKESYKRFHLKNSGFEPSRFDNLHGMRIRINQDENGIDIPETKRLENRFPDTDADPYATVAVTLAAIYYALSRAEMVDVKDGVISPKQEFSPTVDKGPIPKSLQASIEQLEQSVALPTVLNEVSPEGNLGERFVKAASEELRQGNVTATARRSWWSVG